MARPDDDDGDPPDRRPVRRGDAQRRHHPDDEDDDRPRRRRREEDDDEAFAPEPRPRRRAPEPERVRRRRRDDEYEDDEDDGAVSTLIPTGNPKALLAYYFGIFGIIPLVGFILGPLALVFGILGKRHADRHRRAKGGGHAIAGIILGPVDFCVSLAAVIIADLYVRREGVSLFELLTK